MPLAAWGGRRLGDLAWMVLVRRRRIALASLERAFPAAEPAARRALARRSFQHLGLTAAEVCRALVEPVERTLARMDVEGLQNVQSTMAAHGRALVLTAHLGNWELLTLVHRLTGFPLAIVVRTLDAPWLDALVRRLRETGGVEIIDKRDALRRMLDALRRGRMVAVLLDQNATRREGVFVPFFGHPASTSRGLAAIAVRTGTPVVPFFIRRGSTGRHCVTVEPALHPAARNSTREAVVELTMACAASIERAIRAAPEQWLWMHDRWRTRPGDHLE